MDTATQVLSVVCVNGEYWDCYNLCVWIVRKTVFNEVYEKLDIILCSDLGKEPWLETISWIYLICFVINIRTSSLSNLLSP